MVTSELAYDEDVGYSGRLYTQQILYTCSNTIPPEKKHTDTRHLVCRL